MCASEVYLAIYNCLAYPANDETAPPRHSELLSMLRTLCVCAYWCREA